MSLYLGCMSKVQVVGSLKQSQIEGQNSEYFTGLMAKLKVKQICRRRDRIDSDMILWG